MRRESSYSVRRYVVRSAEVARFLVEGLVVAVETDREPLGAAAAAAQHERVRCVEPGLDGAARHQQAVAALAQGPLELR